MEVAKVLKKWYIFLALILMCAYGYVMYFKEENQLRPGFRWIKERLNFKDFQQPVNPLNYPAFQHPLAPPYPYPYKFIFSQADKCRGKKPFLIIMVISEVSDFSSRFGIRNTWGNVSVYDIDVVIIFLLGFPKHFPERIQKLVEEENMINQDIVQQDFLDTYYNLTLKTIMGMEWVSKFCPTASYVMKIDNDMFLNVDYLVHKFLKPDGPVRQNFFTGLIVAGTGPLRDKAYKWYVPKEVYPNDTYPPYCSGPGYLFSADMAKKIYDVSQVIRVTPMEDAYTGICLYELRVSPTEPPPGIFNGHWIEYDRCTFLNLITVHHYGKKDLLAIWDDFLTNTTINCDKGHN
ncbi:beta-1,3-galactosyltransferase 2-like [Gastrophryne carolinensis]